MTRSATNAEGASCLGKERFPNGAAAIRAARNMAWHGKGVDTYRCPACGGFHVCRRPKPKTPLWRNKK